MNDKEENLNIVEHFDNLAPVLNGQNQEVYIKLLTKGIEDKDVKNIALTGSYGSGKSSILKRFLNELPKDKKEKYLEISLANFDKNSKDDEKEQSIERSILQQIFYKVSKDKVPYSKLNRTENKDSKGLWIYAFLFFVWIVSFFVYKQRDAIQKTLDTYDINIQTFLLMGSLIPLLVTTFIIIYLILRGTGKIKLNKLSFQGVNLDISEENKEGSLLNQHIDEILYFFEATEFEVVIIEDLDRHEVTHIFQKLREINILLNSYEKIKSKKKITFIYAVKDSIFTGEERTKFFEMVIPVIPIVNTSNAKDKLITKFKKADLLTTIGNSFLKDISYYIKDLRQLTNIFNEYLVYHHSIVTKNQKDLFSMIVYKNFFPQDFALLHNREGELHEIFNERKEKIKNESLEILNEKLIEVKSKLDEVEKEELENKEELKLLFLGKMVRETNDLIDFNYSGSRISKEKILENEEAFHAYLKGGTLSYYYGGYNSRNSKFNNYFNEYNRRLKILQNKALEEEGKLIKELREIQQQIRDVKYNTPLHQLLKDIDDFTILDLIENKDKKEWSSEEKSNWKLIKHLIKNGYINKEYKTYISYFHEGDLTQSDHEFTVAVKDGESKDFNYALDNTKSVVEELDTKDFDNIYIVNLDLAKYFFDNSTQFKEKRELFIKSIFTKDNQDFIFSLIEKNIEDEKLLSAFVKEILKDKNMGLASIEITLKHDVSVLQKILIFILNHLKELELSDEDIGILSSLLQDYLFDIYEMLRDKNSVKEFLVENTVIYDEITNKMIKVTSLFIFIYRNNLYQFTVNNVKSIMEAIPGKDEWDRDLFYKANLTTVRANDLSYLVEYIDSDINGYFENVINELENNTLESEETLLDLLNNDKLQDRYKQSIIHKSETRINDILDIEDKELWINLFKENKVSASWDNVFNYYIEKNELDSALFTFLNNHDNADNLSTTRIGKNYFEEHEEFAEKGARTLLRDILQKNEFNNNSFKNLSNNLGFWYKDLNLSDLDEDKINMLIDTTCLQPESEVYESIVEKSISCAVRFIERYVDKYLEDELSVDLDSKVVITLLDSKNLTKDKKLQILEKIDNSLYDESKELKEKVSKLYLDSSKHIEDINEFEKLFYGNNKYDLALLVSQVKYWDYATCKTYLDTFEEPYNELLDNPPGFTHLEENDLNKKLVKELRSKDYIGKTSTKKRKIRVYKKSFNE